MTDRLCNKDILRHLPRLRWRNAGKALLAWRYFRSLHASFGAAAGRRKAAFKETSKTPLPSVDAVTLDARKTRLFIVLFLSFCVERKSEFAPPRCTGRGEHRLRVPILTEPLRALCLRGEYAFIGNREGPTFLFRSVRSAIRCDNGLWPKSNATRCRRFTSLDDP